MGDATLDEQVRDPRVVAGRSNWLARAPALVLVCALAFVVMLALRGMRYWVFTLDDAFITLRYSMHLAHGLGPSWNPGGPPAEGYTTTLWMLWLALPIALGADGLLFAKLSGALFALGAVALASHLAWSLVREGGWPRALAAALPWLLSIAYWPLALHAVSGMETTCSALVLTAFFWLAVRVERARVPSAALARALALCALAAALARPEAVLACGVTLLALAVRRDARVPLLRAVALYTALPGALYFAARYAYFGLLFPLSFYVKATGQEAFAGATDVAEFYALFVIARPWWGVLAVLGAHRRRELIPSLLGALAFSVFFLFPEHIMAFEGRYLVPLFPLVAALTGAGAGKLIALLQPKLQAWQLALAIAVLLALACIPTSDESGSVRWLDYGRGLTHAHVKFAQQLRATGITDARVAMLDVGAVGYYADWDTLDTFGLNDAHVAVTQRKDVAYVFRQAPDLLVLVSATPHAFEPVFEWEKPLYAEAERSGYRYACDYQFEPDYMLQVFSKTIQPAHLRQICRHADFKGLRD